MYDLRAGIFSVRFIKEHQKGTRVMLVKEIREPLGEWGQFVAAVLSKG
jgi:hypothetical protein